MKDRREVCAFNYDNTRLSEKLNSTRKSLIIKHCHPRKVPSRNCLFDRFWMTKRACRQEPVSPAAWNIRETPWIRCVCIFISPLASHTLSLKILSSCSLKQIGNAQFAPLHIFLPVPSAYFPEGFSHLHSLLPRGAMLLKTILKLQSLSRMSLHPHLYPASE